MNRKSPLLGILLVLSLSVSAQKKVYTTQKVSGDPPRIDGVLNDASWDQVEWAGDFVQHEPHAEAPATQKTEFKVIYDDDNIYFAVRCWDTAPDSIVRRMTRRDGDVGDWVKIVIDSYHDLLTGYSFGVSAAGVKLDEAVTNGGNFDDSWDPIWDVKTSIDDKGWNVEAGIPLSQLRFSDKEEHVWGLDIGRRLYRKEEISLWQFFSPNAPGMIHLFGELHGIKNIKPKKQKDITPYVATGLETYEPEEDNPFEDGLDLIFNAGVDGKIGVTNNLTLDFTINPDFGQIEADPSEINLTTFETKFDERRPFFIEGKNILSFNLLNGGGPLSDDNIFYSRRIGKAPTYWPDLNDDEYIDRPENTSILGAFKLTGKTEKGWSVGIMESITQKETAQIYRGDEENLEQITIEPLSNYFVTRVQRDMNESNTQLGAMVSATNRSLKEPALQDFMHDQAYSGGIDFYHTWKEKTYYINLIAAASRVIGTQNAIYETQTSSPHYFQRPEQTHMKADSGLTHLDGFGATVHVGKQGNSKLMWTLWVTARSPGLNLNDLGYINRTDEIQEIFWVGFSQREPVWIFRTINLNFNQWAATTFGLENRYYGGNINCHFMFKNYWSFGFGVDREGNGLLTNTLRGGPAMIYDGATGFYPYIRTDERKRFQFFYNYFMNRVDNQLGRFDSHSVTMRIRFSDAWSFSLSPGLRKNFDKLAYVNTLDELEDPRYIRGTMRQTTTQLVIRSDYSITPDLTIQLYMMPFISAANYTELKYITDADAKNVQDRFLLYSDDQLSYNVEDEIYEVDETLNGTMDYSFDQPNFNYYDFNLNMVVRWEYRPGSTLYLVWSQNRNDYTTLGDFMLLDNANTLFRDTDPRNIVMLKLSHRFGL